MLGSTIRRELTQGLRDIPQAGVCHRRRHAAACRSSSSTGQVAGVEPVNRYLRDRILGDVSPLTCRSYALRLVALVPAAVDARDRLGARRRRLRQPSWSAGCATPAIRSGGAAAGSPPPGSVNMRTGKPEPGAGYAPATIAHALTVVSGFYGFHMHFGDGPPINPGPENSSRRAALAHRSPLERPAFSPAGTTAAQVSAPRGAVDPGRPVRGVVRADAQRQGPRAAGLLRQLGSAGLRAARTADGGHRLGRKDRST